MTEILYPYEEEYFEELESYQKKSKNKKETKFNKIQIAAKNLRKSFPGIQELQIILNGNPKFPDEVLETFFDFHRPENLDEKKVREFLSSLNNVKTLPTEVKLLLNPKGKGKGKKFYYESSVVNFKIVDGKIQTI